MSRLSSKFVRSTILHKSAEKENEWMLNGEQLTGSALVLPLGMMSLRVEIWKIHCISQSRTIELIILKIRLVINHFALPLTRSTSMNSVRNLAFFNGTCVKPLNILCSTVFSHCCLSYVPIFFWYLVCVYEF